MSTKKGYKSVPWLFGKAIEIPEEWEVVKLSETGDLINGLNKEKEDYGHGCLHVNINNIFESFSIIPEKLGRVNATQKEIDTYALQKGDICILRSSVKREGVGYPSLFENNHTSIVFSGFIIRFRPHMIWNPTYLTFLLRSVFMRNIVVSKSSSSANTNINQKSLGSIQMIIPSLPEQQQIATILSNVDNLIQSTSKIIENSKSLKTGLMQKLLTRGIGHTKFKKVPWLFGKEIEIPEEWEVLPLSKICNIRETDSIKSDLYVGLEHISQKDNKLIGQGTTKEFTSNTNSFHNNDVLYGKLRPLLNKVWLATEDGHCSTDILPLQTKDNIIPTILLLILTDNRFFWYAVSTSSGTKMPRTNWSDMKNFLVFLPSISEQQKIASILSNIDSKITSQEQYKEKLLLLKKSLMQKLLTGEVRVAI